MRKLVVPALAALAFAAPANAAMAEETTSIVIERTQTGSATLEARIEHAAEKVCGRPFIRDLRAMASFKSCVAEATANALAAAELAAADGKAKRG